MFQQARIQLPTEEQSTNTSPPPLIKRSSSNWSIPCCSNFSIRGQRIQLPDDSDNEEQEEFIINNSHQDPTAAPFTMSFDSSNENTFTQHASNLSRNPFARVTEEERPPSKKSVPEVESETLSIEAEASEESLQQKRGEEDVEELADFTTHSFTANKYANEPDWTEMYQDEEEASVKDEPILNTQQNIQQVLQESQITDDSLLSSQQSIREEVEDEEDIPASPKITVKEVEKIPQIDEQVLHLLPLPELSNEIPPALIHKKPSFERSMYGDEPLTSISTKKPTNRISRFSMTEEDFLKLKKQEEEEKNKLTHTKSVDKPKETKIPALKEEEEVESLSVSEESVSQQTNTKQQQEEPLMVTQHQQRRSSIVATAAQSILGDKLDDFTEKLAFIKKNIIMSIDSDDDEDIEEADNAETTLKKIAQMKNEQTNTPSIKTGEEQATTTTTATRPPNHRRASSLMDVGPTIARFMNQISGTNSTEEKRQVSPTSTTSTSFSPSSLFSALAGPEPSVTTNTKSVQPKSSDEQEEDEEELFDFTKVIEIGKNVKSFSEGFVGNGIRMFNDVATRMKNSAEEEERQRNASQKSDEDDDNDDHSNWLNDSYI